MRPSRAEERSRLVERAPDDVTRLSRDDLVASVEAFRRRNGSWYTRLPIVGFVGGLATGVALMALTDIFDWSAGLDPYFFALGWAIALSFAFVGIRREQKVLRDHQWNCLRCYAPMIVPDSEGQLTRAETAIASGRCPACGEELFP